MEKIKIITDSTLDLPADLIKEKGIEVLPLLINFGEESYLDGVEINIHQMLERIEKDNILPTTAQVTPNRFEEVFKKYLELESVRAVANYINELGYRVKTNSYVGERKYIGTDITKIILSDIEIDKELKEVVKLIQELNYEHMSKKWG